jgi:hypothetical protein
MLGAVETGVGSLAQPVTLAEPDPVLLDRVRTSQPALHAPENRPWSQGRGGGQTPNGGAADLYVATRTTVGQLDGMVGSILGVVPQFTQSPPSAEGNGSAEWGPVTPPLSPATFRVVAALPGAGTSPGFALEVKPSDASDDAFQPYLVGGAAGFQADLSLLHSLDPIAMPLQGSVTGNVQSGPGGSSIQVQLQLGASDGSFSGSYAHNQAPDGSGNMVLQSPQQTLTSEWSSSGAGKASVQQANGSALLECWDAMFQPVFIRAEPQGITAGDPSQCAL